MLSRLKSIVNNGDTVKVSSGATNGNGIYIVMKGSQWRWEKIESAKDKTERITEQHLENSLRLFEITLDTLYFPPYVFLVKNNIF